MTLYEVGQVFRFSVTPERVEHRNVFGVITEIHSPASFSASVLELVIRKNFSVGIYPVENLKFEAANNTCDGYVIQDEGIVGFTKNVQNVGIEFNDGHLGHLGGG